jgi:hypothetical protein
VYCTGERLLPPQHKDDQCLGYDFCSLNQCQASHFFLFLQRKIAIATNPSFRWRTRSLVLNFVLANGNNSLAIMLPGLLIHACSISEVIARCGTLHLINPFLISGRSYLYWRTTKTLLFVHSHSALTDQTLESNIPRRCISC